MPKLYLLEDPNGDARICGIAIAFDDGKPAVLTQWRHGAPLSAADVLATAKDCAARALDHLVRQGRTQEAEFTNWVSVVAAAQAHIAKWNEGLKQLVYSEGAGVAGERLIQ